MSVWILLARAAKIDRREAVQAIFARLQSGVLAREKERWC